MAVTYYVALPFIRTEDGTAPGEAQECQSESAAIRRAEGMSRDPTNAGAVAFKRAGDPTAERIDGQIAVHHVVGCGGHFSGRGFGPRRYRAPGACHPGEGSGEHGKKGASGTPRSPRG
jgi:hypothetical protein